MKPAPRTSWKAIGDALGVSQQRACQIGDQALLKILMYYANRPAKAKLIRDHLRSVEAGREEYQITRGGVESL